MAERGGPVLGYLVVEDRDGVFEGAALVADTRGIPLDFRYTEPVRPTRLERILYGSALDLYLREDVLLKNLIESVETRPTLWILRDRELLRSARKHAKVPAVCLEGTTASPLDQAGLLEPQGDKHTFLFQADPISAPLRLSVTEDQLGQIQKITADLMGAAEEMELLEPFSRMAKALESIREHEPL